MWGGVIKLVIFLEKELKSKKQNFFFGGGGGGGGGDRLSDFFYKEFTKKQNFFSVERGG